MPFSEQRHDEVRQAGQSLLRRIEASMEAVDWPSFFRLAEMLTQASRTFVTGAGRSGLVARMFAMRIMHAGLPSFVPGETTTPAAKAGDLLVAISCTGQTGYTTYLADRARGLGSRVVVITAEPESPLAKMAERVVVVPARDDDIVLRAAVFEHATSLCLDAVFNILSDRLKLDADAFQARHANLE